MQGNFVSSISGKRIRFVFNIMLPSIVMGLASTGRIIRKGNEIWVTKGFDTFERASKLGIIQDKKMPRAEVTCKAIIDNDGNTGKTKKARSKNRTVISTNTITHPADQFNGVYGRTQAFLLLLENMVESGLISKEDANNFFENATFRKSNEAYFALYNIDHPKLVKPVKVKVPYVRETAGV